MKHDSNFVIYAALVGNLLVAGIKFVAAALTGSSSMLTEGVHSIVDTGNQALLLYGRARSRRPPDRDNPLGHGRELYFWSFIVALLIFSLGAGISIYEGILHIRTPQPIERPLVNYIVLGLAAVFEGASWALALRAFNNKRGEKPIWQAVQDDKDPTTFIVLFEDSAAMIGIAIAAASIFASIALGMPVLDGVGSVLIGLVLAGTAVLLARETKGLLIGERADDLIIADVQRLAAEQSGVIAVNGILSAQLGPDQIVITLSLEFEDAMQTPAIEDAVNGIERRVRETHKQVTALFVKPQTRAGFEKARIRLSASLTNT
jgi:cation diffusion facilitator family transporter